MDTKNDNPQRIDCPICGGLCALRFVNVSDPDSGDTFSILGCKSCEIGITYPVPTDLGRYYSADYYGNRHGITADICDRRRLKILSRYTELSESGRLLDMGCGDGSFLMGARKSGWTTVGIETFADAARRRGLDVYESIDKACGKFDCITMWHVMEHLPDPLLVLDQLVDLLEPDGVLILAVPDAGSTQARLFGGDWLHLDVPRHLFHFNRTSLQTVFSKKRFEIDIIPKSELEYDIMGWTQSVLNRLIPVPNVLLRQLSGRPLRASFVNRVISLLLGSILIGLFTVPCWLMGIRGNGGTLIAVARQRDREVV